MTTITKGTGEILLTLIISIIVASIPFAISIHPVAAQTVVPSHHSITQVGVRAFKNAAEFQPLTIGRASVSVTEPTVAVHVFDSKILRYNDPTSFPLNTTKYVTGTMNVVLKNTTTLLSKPISVKNINYIEGGFRTLSIQNPKDNHDGILWNDGNEQYYAFLRSSALTIYTQDRGEIISVPAVHPIGKWDTLRVVYSDGLFHVFLNNVHKIQLKATTTDATSNECFSGIGFISCK